MTVKEAKEKAVKYGALKLSDGVWLMTGEEAIDESGMTEPDDIISTDDFRNPVYLLKNIIPDQLYIQTNSGGFDAADDSDIEKCIA